MEQFNDNKQIIIHCISVEKSDPVMYNYVALETFSSPERKPEKAFLLEQRMKKPILTVESKSDPLFLDVMISILGFIIRKLKSCEKCEACEIEDPSQLHHSCLENEWKETCDWYYDEAFGLLSFDVICPIYALVLFKKGKLNNFFDAKDQFKHIMTRENCKLRKKVCSLNISPNTEDNCIDKIMIDMKKTMTCLWKN